ncbi:MAG: hypothetical protein GXZ02_07435, partial [Clostridiales bacterium]|nr:hypothetical protein [Clostridiales bacterium]
RLKNVEKFDIINKDGTKGAYHLYPESIQVFEPISYKELLTVCPDVKPFSQVKQNLAVNALPKLQNLIEKKTNGYDL